jgi:hypothetical protein
VQEPAQIAAPGLTNLSLDCLRQHGLAAPTRAPGQGSGHDRRRELQLNAERRLGKMLVKAKAASQVAEGRAARKK